MDFPGVVTVMGQCVAAGGCSRVATRFILRVPIIILHQCISNRFVGIQFTWRINKQSYEILFI